jgi:hypothetical protein
MVVTMLIIMLWKVRYIHYQNFLKITYSLIYLSIVHQYYYSCKGTAAIVSAIEA